MKKILCILLAVLSLLGATAFAEDFSFLDGMSVSELEAVITEAQRRIDAANNSYASANPNDMGIWAIGNYVDEFGLPTNKYYLTEKNWTVGTFSNSAVTDRKLYISFLIDTKDIAISLYEYGDSRVKNSGSRTRTYDVIMMDNNGVRYSFTGYMYSGGDRIHFDKADETKIINALSLNGTVRFVITESDRPTTKYKFVLESTAYFTNAYNVLLGK